MIAMQDFPAVTTKQAAEIIGCTPDNVRILTLTGKLVGVKWGRDWRIDERSVRAYAATEQKTGRPRTVKKS